MIWGTPMTKQKPPYHYSPLLTTIKSLLFTIINHEIPWESHFSSPLITINHYWIQQWLSPIFKQTRKAKRPLQLTLLQTWPTLGPKKLPGLYGYWWYINGMGLDMGCITNNMMIYIYDYIWLYMFIYDSDYIWLYMILSDKFGETAKPLSLDVNNHVPNNKTSMTHLKICYASRFSQRRRTLPKRTGLTWSAQDMKCDGHTWVPKDGMNQWPLVSKNIHKKWSSLYFLIPGAFMFDPIPHVVNQQ